MIEMDRVESEGTCRVAARRSAARALEGARGGTTADSSPLHTHRQDKEEDGVSIDIWVLGEREVEGQTREAVLLRGGRPT